VLERRLAGRGHELTHVSPVGGGPVWGDCVETISTGEAMARVFDGMVVGGGHLIHGQPSDVPAYREAEGHGLLAYADLWLGATLRACELGIPIVWNAPGVPGPFPPETAACVRWAASQAEYLAVRDGGSRQFLEGAGIPGEVVVTLDTAIDVADLWSPEALDSAWRDVFRTRDLPIPDRALAVHFNSRFLADGVIQTAARLDQLARTRKLMPILLAIGPCHGDSALQREVAEAMQEPCCLVDTPRSLREIAACIRGASLYVGSSLHGAVTARSFDRPAIVVAREAAGGHAKFSGFLAAHARLVESARGEVSQRVDGWGEAWDRVDRILSAAAESRAVGGPDDRALRETLDQHWRRLEDALERPSLRDGSSRRAGLDAFERLRLTRWRRETPYVGLLLDQAREASKYRETAQKSTRRFRELERIHRDLQASVQTQRGSTNDTVAGTEDNGNS
jgi:hypothetical protein